MAFGAPLAQFGAPLAQPGLGVQSPFPSVEQSQKQQQLDIQQQQVDLQKVESILNFVGDGIDEAVKAGSPERLATYSDILNKSDDIKRFLHMDEINLGIIDGQPGLILKDELAVKRYLDNIQKMKDLGLPAGIPEKGLKAIERVMPGTVQDIANAGIRVIPTTAELAAEKTTSVEQAKEPFKEAQFQRQLAIALAQTKSTLPKEFLNREPVKNLTESINTLAGVADLVKSKNPLADSAIPRQLARTVGQEVGVMTDQDVRAFGGSKALARQVSRLVSVMESGLIPAKDRKDILDLLEVTAKRNESLLRGQLGAFAKTQSAFTGIAASEILSGLQPEVDNLIDVSKKTRLDIQPEGKTTESPTTSDPERLQQFLQRRRAQ